MGRFHAEIVLDAALAAADRGLRTLRVSFTMPSMTDSLLPLLKQSFGYDAFRPLQREIMAASLAGKDVVAILPTGAGKSLCFQLPALAREGVTLVVSPLIALMKDQVDALTASGVAATFLNSSIQGSEAQRRRSGLENGHYKLLYAAPERVMMQGFVEDLQRWNVTAIAVDEAHCISEWGHDFRPEYRQLAQLRAKLPGVPFLALTATATEQVRGDIIRQLQLPEPEVFLASFNRPNLSYSIVPKSQSTRQVYEFIRERPNDAGIVYVQSRKSAESLAAALLAEGREGGGVSRGIAARGAGGESRGLHPR
jgi:ATP-dependent DNA helicase RecQ